jgi:hypothetical protein
MSFNYPDASLILTPTLARFSVYCPRVVPSSRVSPSFKSFNLANNVLKAVPTTSAL